MFTEFNEQVEIDCLDIELKQNEADKPLIYRGAGSTTRTIDGRLELKMYCNNFNFFNHLQKSGTNYQLGALVDESSYFCLTAIDLKGQEWTSKRIHPLNYHSFSHGTILSAVLEEICCVQETLDDAEHAFLDLVFSGNIEIPCNTFTETSRKLGEEKKFSATYNAAQFLACGNTFILRKEQYSLHLRMISNTATLSENMDLRICEALQFVLAQSIPRICLETHRHNKKTLRIRSNSIQLAAKNHSPHPPINLSNIRT